MPRCSSAQRSVASAWREKRKQVVSRVRGICDDVTCPFLHWSSLKWFRTFRMTFRNVEYLINIKINKHFTFIFSRSNCLQQCVAWYSLMKLHSLSLNHLRNDKTVDTRSQQSKINYRSSLSFALSVRNYDTYSPAPAAENNFWWSSEVCMETNLY